ncbi:MAG: YafY family protein [Salinivirgaceae bacterium]|jgi:predicted DNA-binding transcriptional regulator YafY|nr:YafY family protein [Salinivirgaceae bacterium]
MNRIDRLQAILTQLQSKKVVKAKEIADRFEISIRTVYRDIRALEEGGIPIGAEAGIGYFLDESYSLPPVMFTTKEAISLLLAGKLIPHMSDKKVDTAFQEALYKIKSVMRADDKDVLEKLEKTIQVFSGVSEPAQKDSIFLHDIQQALVGSNVCQMEYYSQYNQKFSERKIEPVSLIFYAMNWHLIAWCRLRKSYRDFRLDRIQNFFVLEDTYERKLDESYEEYLESQKEQLESYEVKLKVTKQLAHWINESKYWYGFVSENTSDDDIEMIFLNPDLFGFARWVITMTDKVEVVSPMELVEILKGMVLELCGKYKSI